MSSGGVTSLVQYLAGDNDTHKYQDAVRLRVGHVISVASGTATITIGGDTTQIAGVPYIGGTPSVASNNSVLVLQQGSQLVVLGTPANFSGGVTPLTDVAYVNQPNVFTQINTFNANVVVNANVQAGGPPNTAAQLSTLRTAGDETNGVVLENDNLGGYGSAIRVFSKQNFGGNAILESARLQVQGESSWASAPNTNTFFRVLLQTAGTLTERMRLNSNGQLQLPATGSTGGLLIGGDTTLFRVSANVLSLNTGLQVHNGSYMAIGRAPIRDYLLVTDVNHPGTSTNVAGILMQPAFPATTTNYGAQYEGNVRTVASAFTMSSGYVFHANAPALGATSAVTTMVGAQIENQGVSGVTNAYGIFVAPQSGASNFNIGARIDSAAAGALWLAGDTNTTGNPGAINWGTGRDTNLYRSGVSTLHTDGKFEVTQTGTTGSIVITNSTGGPWHLILQRTDVASSAIEVWNDSGSFGVFNNSGARMFEANQVGVFVTASYLQPLGNSGLPSSVANQPIFAGGFSSPNSGRLYIGDGTGWSFRFAKRTGSADTDLFFFADSGVFTTGSHIISGGDITTGAASVLKSTSASDLFLDSVGAATKIHIRPNNQTEVGLFSSTGLTMAATNIIQFTSGYTYAAQATGVALLMNSPGSDWGNVGANAANKWQLGHGGNGVLGTAVLEWEATPRVRVIGQLLVAPTSDQVVFQVTGNGTQTNPYVQIQNNGGTHVYETLYGESATQSTINQWLTFQNSPSSSFALVAGNSFITYLTPVANSSYEAWNSMVTQTNATVNWTGGVYGFLGQAYHPGTSTGTINLAVGVFGKVQSDASAGNITQAYAVFGKIQNNATVTTGTSFYAEQEYGASGAGTGAAITNSYGFLISARLKGSTLSVGGRIDVPTGAGSKVTLWLAGDVDPTTAPGGITFGTSRDTSLYRYTTSGVAIDGSTGGNILLVRGSTTQLQWGDRSSSQDWIGYVTSGIFRLFASTDKFAIDSSARTSIGTSAAVDTAKQLLITSSGATTEILAGVINGASNPAAGIDRNGSVYARNLNYKKRAVVAQSGYGSTGVSQYDQHPTILSYGTQGQTIIAPYSLVTFTTSASINDKAGWVGLGGNICERDLEPDCSIVISTGATITSYRVWAGLTSADLSGVGAPTTQHVMAFRYDTGTDGTTWHAITCNGASGVTNTDSTITVSASTVYRFRIVYDAANAAVRFFINDQLVATHSTNLPGATTGLFDEVNVNNLAAATRAMGFSEMITYLG